MENRDRDKMSKNPGSTEVDDLNRSTSERKGRVESDSNADFGENIGRSEKWDNEPSRRSGNLEGDSGRTSGSSDIDSDLEESGSSNIGSSSRGGNVGVGSERNRNRSESEH